VQLSDCHDTTLNPQITGSGRDGEEGRRMPRALLIGFAAACCLTIVSAKAASPPHELSILVRPQRVLSLPTVVLRSERGSAWHQTYLGYMYETGRGVPQDYHLAAYWYRCAAEQGFAPAQHLLGLLYDRGQGVPLDYVEAHKWLNLAAARAPANNRDDYVRLRNAVASKLTRAQIYDAQRRARDWTLAQTQ
jgi:TPR repeat protein